MHDRTGTCRTGLTADTGLQRGDTVCAIHRCHASMFSAVFSACSRASSLFRPRAVPLRFQQTLLHDPKLPLELLADRLLQTRGWAAPLLPVPAVQFPRFGRRDSRAVQ